MLIHELRKTLSSKSIAERNNKSKWTIDNMLSWVGGYVWKDMLDYETAWQVLFLIKERHDNYVKENVPHSTIEHEWEMFLDNNTH